MDYTKLTFRVLIACQKLELANKNVDEMLKVQNANFYQWGINAFINWFIGRLADNINPEVARFENVKYWISGTYPIGGKVHAVWWINLTKVLMGIHGWSWRTCHTVFFGLVMNLHNFLVQLLGFNQNLIYLILILNSCSNAWIQWSNNI